MARRSCCYTKTPGVENPGFNKWISAGNKQVRVRKVRGGVEVDMRSKPAKKRKPAKRRNSVAPRASRRQKQKVQKRVSAALKRFMSRR